jgi:hypothetical protein
MVEKLIESGMFDDTTHDVQLPMYVRGPGIPAGSVSEKMVSNGDIARTFADMGKVPQASEPGFVDGRSLLPLAKGKPVEWRDFAYSAAWPDLTWRTGGRSAPPDTPTTTIREQARRYSTTSQGTPMSLRTSFTGRLCRGGGVHPGELQGSLGEDERLLWSRVSSHRGGYVSVVRNSMRYGSCEGEECKTQTR